MVPSAFEMYLRTVGRSAWAVIFSLHQNAKARPQSLIAMLAVLWTLALYGCGSGTTSTSQVGTPATYPGLYAGSASLDGGQPASLDMTIASDGGATASLVVGNGSSRQAAPTRLVDATYTLTGAANLQNGTYSLNGGVSGAATKPIRVSGILPASSGASNLFNLIFNGKTYRGTLTRNGSGSTSGQNSTVNFAGATNTNANTSSFSGVTAFATQNLPVIGSTTSIVVGLPSGQRQVNIHINAALTAGATYVPGDDTTIVQYVDGTKLWNGQGGKVVIDTINGSNITFRVLNVPMSPYPVVGTGASASGSTGTFVLSVNANASSPGGNPGGGPSPTNSLVISGLTANTTIARNGPFVGTVQVDKFGDQYSFAIVNDLKASPLTEFSGDIFVANATVGQTVDLTNAGAGNVAYQEKGTLFYIATSGTETFDAVSSTSVTISFHNVRFQAQTPSTGSTGEFTLNGTFTAPVTNR